MMTVLNPFDYDIIDVPYASNIYWELFYDSDCLEKIHDESCFRVHVSHEGNPLRFSGCLEENAANNDPSPFCTYRGWMNYLDKVKYPGDPYEKCAEVWVPPADNQ